MYYQTYSCLLKQPVVLFEKAKTEVNLFTLDYIPGNVFRGVVATELYDEDKVEQTLDIFHKGEVQFGDANIIKNHNKSYKIPAICYKDKTKKNEWEDGRREVSVFLHEEITEGKIEVKVKAFKEGYFAESNQELEILNPEFGVRIKSAYDREKRTSKDEQLFLYRFLKKGQKFVFEIRAKNKDYLTLIHDKLEGIQYIGRSKTAEFGRVFIEKAGDIKSYDDEKDRLNDIPLSGNLTIYAESDLCFVDAYGEYTQQPSPEDLGVTGGKIDWKLSKIWLDRYAPWNGKRNTWDAERLIIKKGSVFVLEGVASIDAEKVTEGIGYFKAEGLGRIIIEPEFFNLIRDNNTPIYELKDPKLPEPAKKESGSTISNLVKGLTEKQEQQDADHKIYKAINLFREDNKHNFSGISASQWGGIYAVVRQASDDAELVPLLFQKEEGYLCRGKLKDKWAKEIGWVWWQKPEDGEEKLEEKKEKKKMVKKQKRKEALEDWINTKAPLGNKRKLIMHLALEMAKYPEK